MAKQGAAVNVAEAKKHLSDLLGRVAYGGESVLITRRGKPMARLVPAQETGVHPGDIRGWLDDDDPYFKIVERIVEGRGRHRPKSVESIRDRTPTRVSGFLLDTNVLSELLRKRPDAGVLEHIKAVRPEQLSTSVVCAFELRYGAVQHPKGLALWARISREVLSSIPALPLGMEEALAAGDILADLERRGEPIGIEDVLIAATALRHGRVVVTRNVRHFSRVRGLRVASWWS